MAGLQHLLGLRRHLRPKWVQHTGLNLVGEVAKEPALLRRGIAGVGVVADE
jgi:hypothetical protein